jgi:HEAT repeat protein
VDVEGSSNDEQYVSLTQLFQVVDECYETGAFYVGENGTLVADDARVGAVRRRHAPERADTAIKTLRRASPGPEYVQAINDIITFHDTQAVEPLLHVLEESQSTDSGAIVALGVLGGEDVVEPLLRLVREWPSPEPGLTGMAALWAEAQHHMDPEGAASSHLRDSAMQAVVGVAERLHLLLPAEPFVASLRDPFSYIWQRAIWALEGISTAEARNALADTARDSGDDDLLRAAQQALDRLHAACDDRPA